MPLRYRIPTVQPEVQLVKQTTPAWRHWLPDGPPASMTWEAGTVRRDERQAVPFLDLVGVAAALIGHRRLTARPGLSGARTGGYEEAERMACRVEQDAYIVLRLEVHHRRPEGKSILDGR